MLDRIRLLLCTFIMLCAVSPLVAQWQDISPEGVTHHFRSIAFVDEMTGFASGWLGFNEGSVQGVIARTMDGGNVWQVQTFNDVEISAMAFADEDNGFLVGKSATCDCPLILRTDDGGLTWGEVVFDNLAGAFRGIDFYDETRGAIGGGNPQTGEGFVISVEITPEGDEMAVIFQEQLAHVSRVTMPTEEVIVVNGGEFAGAETSIYKTTNAGAENPDDVEWEKLHTFEGIVLVTGVDFVDEETGYTGLTVIDGSNFGGAMYKTTDGGETWEQVYSSDSYTLVGLDFLDGERGIASGSGVIIMTNDGGETWSEMIPPTEDLGVWAEYVSPGVAYIAGTNGSILKYTPASGVDRSAYEVGVEGATVVPNPASTVLRISLVDFVESRDYTLRVFDLHGREVHRMALRGGEGVLAVEELSSGVYFYRILDGDQVTARGRFVVQ